MNPAANLVLVGPMGAGKTCIGRRLAEHFGLRLADADHEIEQRAGTNINTIFEVEGEHGFRTRERAALAMLLHQDGLVISTGGGAVLDPDNRRLMHARGFVIHLDVSVERQLERLAHDRSRPLLARGDREAVLHALAVQRAPLYAEVADLRFDTNPYGSVEAATRLALELDAHWQRPALGTVQAGVPASTESP